MGLDQRFVLTVNGNVQEFDYRKFYGLHDLFCGPLAPCVGRIPIEECYMEFTLKHFDKFISEHKLAWNAMATKYAGRGVREHELTSDERSLMFNDDYMEDFQVLVLLLKKLVASGTEFTFDYIYDS